MSKVRLGDNATKIYSQFGEDGILDKIFQLAKIERGFVIDIGAFDGIDCSNSAYFWKNNYWDALLFEGDVERYLLLMENTKDYDHVRIANCWITPHNVDNMLGVTGCDLLSIDVDGDEWAILQNLHFNPKVLVVEFNQSMPWWLHLRPADLNSQLGSSAKAFLDLLGPRNYELVAVTDCNLIFVQKDLFPLDKYETDPEVLLDDLAPTYFITDYRGRYHAVGRTPWGVLNEPMNERILDHY